MGDGWMEEGGLDGGVVLHYGGTLFVVGVEG